MPLWHSCSYLESIEIRNVGFQKAEILRHRFSKSFLRSCFVANESDDCILEIVGESADELELCKGAKSVTVLV